MTKPTPQIQRCRGHFDVYVLTGFGKTVFSRDRDYLTRLIGRYIRRFGWTK